jgi:ribosomal protein L11 methyltransferase
MKWIEFKVIYEAGDPETAGDLIASIFDDLGLQGVVVETPDLVPAEGWGEGAVPLPEHRSVAGFFPDNDAAAEKCRKVESEVSRLSEERAMTFTTACRTIDDEDWAESWKAYFWPKKISDRFVVKPTWRSYAPAEGEEIIEIDPGMAFGTGAHATTRLCIRMLETYLRPGESFLDVGTGSGILMIAAARLGAGRMAGVDSDQTAVETAEKNLLLNRIAPERFRLHTGHLVDAITEKFDLVAANILSEIIITLVPDLPSALKKGGIFIASGISAGNSRTVTERLEAAGFKILEVLEEEEWTAVAAFQISNFKSTSGTAPPS